jgi:hypothetical protein
MNDSGFWIFEDDRPDRSGGPQDLAAGVASVGVASIIDFLVVAVLWQTGQPCGRRRVLRILGAWSWPSGPASYPKRADACVTPRRFLGRASPHDAVALTTTPGKASRMRPARSASE